MPAEKKRWPKSLLVILAAMLLVGAGLQYAVARQYRAAAAGYQYEFPRDHAAHPGFKTEWWYYTGHLQGTNGKRYGYELTFFRSQTKEETEKSTNPWNLENAYAAHFAVSDIGEKRFFFEEKLNRAGLGIAGANDQVYNVWNELWFAELLGQRHLLRASSKEHELHLLLTEEKPPVIHGRNGISQKATCEGCASHYYSLTQLKTEGVVYDNGQPVPVTGYSWMDHEFGSNQLSPDQVGWDWFSVQLSDGTELMLYLMRRKDGTLDVNSSGTFIAKNGASRYLAAKEYTVTPLGYWTSPKTKGKYPMGWRVEVPSQQLSLTLRPAFEDQELVTEESTKVAYWEGATDVEGTAGGNPVTGQAYVEMTGYAAPFSERI